MNVTDEQAHETLKNLNYNDFDRLVNSEFKVYQGENVFAARLVEVSKPKIYPRQTSFDLFFLLPNEFGRAQGNYVFEHESFGATRIFVAPIETGADGTIFQAVFNRIAENTE